jgi:putative NIF3 family GTP cyclohydrolase 1 type 2
VTGDLRHHVALDALQLGMALIDAGHFATEAAALPMLCDRLAAAAAARGLTAGLLASATTTEPWSDYCAHHKAKAGT